VTEVTSCEEDFHSANTREYHRHYGNPQRDVQTVGKPERPLTPEQLRQPPGAGERSFTEAIVHLINGEERTSQSMYMALLAYDTPVKYG
jgi:hypothetical protein